MLVLSRAKDQSLTLTLPDGRTVTVVVCGVDRGRVEVGIQAPADVKVLRTELYDRTRPQPAKGDQ